LSTGRRAHEGRGDREHRARAPRSGVEHRVLARRRARRGERGRCGRQVEMAEHARRGLSLGHDRDRTESSFAPSAHELEGEGLRFILHLLQ